MNRKTKIIVSVVGIVIVTLALLGITYAYYLTRIQGNTNTNSISLTTANLLLKYDDGSGAIVEENIMPGVTFEKTFSVTNEGNATIDNYVVYLEEVINDLTRTQDLTYTLTCDTCEGSNGEYPKLASIIATNSIEVGQTHTYTLTITYENLTNTDQSIDMGSRISGYIQIYNLTDIVEIEGQVTGVNEGDYAQLNSEPKISQIVNNKYKFVGVTPGNHTLSIYTKDGVLRGSKPITIRLGETAKIEDEIITVNEASKSVGINITSVAQTLGVNYGEITQHQLNPFKKGTLAYDILENAKVENSSTKYRDVPLTKVAEENSQYQDGYRYLTIHTYSLTADYLPWHIGDTKEEALKGNTVTSFEEAVHHYVYDESSFDEFQGEPEYQVLYLEAYDSSTSILTFRLEKYETEKTLSYVADDYTATTGIPSYYFRGDVEDNYVSFAGYTWRIVRIAGDGSIKLVIAGVASGGRNGNCSYDTEGSCTSYGSIEKDVDNDSSNETIMSYLNPEADKATAMVGFAYDFQTTKLEGYEEYLKSGGWCLGEQAYIRNNSSPFSYTLLQQKDYSKELYYDAYMRLSGENKNGYLPTLKCNGTIMNEFLDVSSVSSKVPMYVATLTVDELTYAGLTEESSPSYFQNFVEYAMFTLSPKKYNSNQDKTYILSSSSHGCNISEYGMYDNSMISFYPAVSLKKDITATTNSDIENNGLPGTQTNPYVIN